MMKKLMIKETVEILREAGFWVSDCSMVRSCFDVLARRGDTVLLIKLLLNIEGLSHRSAGELKSVAAAMSGIPLVVGDHMKNSRLSPDVVYTRYDIHVVGIEAFAEIVGEKTPLVYSIRGNYCVRINPGLLSDVRRRLGMTQEELASQLGVSKQSIHRYESSGRVSLDIAERLMDFLREDLVVPGEVFTSEVKCIEDEVTSFMTDLKKTVLREFMGMGFETSLTNAPFDILASERGHREKILTIVSNDRQGLRRKVEIIRDISEIMGCHKVCISNRSQNLDVLVIKPKELSEINKASEFMKLLVD